MRVTAEVPLRCIPITHTTRTGRSLPDSWSSAEGFLASCGAAGSGAPRLAKLTSLEERILDRGSATPPRKTFVNSTVLGAR